MNYAVPSSALYHLDRVEKFQEGQPTDQIAMAQLVRAVALEELGDLKMATQYYEIAKKIDPGVVHATTLRTYGVSTKLAQRLSDQPKKAPSPETIVRPDVLARLSVNASLSQATVKVGKPVTITVEVLAPSKEPIVGATVTLSAGGGQFWRAGKTKIQGKTDPKGMFVSSWFCRACA